MAPNNNSVDFRNRLVKANSRFDQLVQALNVAKKQAPRGEIHRGAVVLMRKIRSFQTDLEKIVTIIKVREKKGLAFDSEFRKKFDLLLKRASQRSGNLLTFLECLK